MATDLEKIVLNAVGVNDQVKFSMESMTFTPAQAKAKFAENPNADGVVLVEEPQYTPAYFEMMVRVIGTKTTDEALASIGTIMDMLTECAKTEGGSELEWTPNEAATTYAAYVLLGELLEIPITTTGELAGWFVEFPVLKIKLTCRPFLFTDERLVLSAVASEEQFQTAYIKGIKGDVPAEVRAIVTDKAGFARNYIEWGQDLVETESNPSIRIKADVMAIAGFSGVKTTKAGSVSTEVISSALVSSPVTICSTGPIANLGTYRAKLRLFATGAAFLRIAYRVGEGGTTARSWVGVPVFNEWVEIDLRELFLDEVERGEQVSEILIQGYTNSASIVVYVDTLSMPPTKRYAVGRGQLNYTEASTMALFDKFEQATGALAGKSAEIGGLWEGAGDTDDFSVFNGGFGPGVGQHYGQRTAVSDVAGTPRYAFFSTKYSNIVLNLEVGTTNGPYDAALFMGLLARYVDVNNWAAFVVTRSKSEIWPGINANQYSAQFYKKVAGVKTLVGYAGEILSPIVTGTAVYSIPLQLIMLSTGEWKLGAYGKIVLSGNDPVFNSTGALKEGKVGIFDEKTGFGAETRYYDSFSGFVPLVKLACNPNKAVEINTREAEMESISGKYWSPVPEYRGADLYLDPAGQDGMINRLTAKMRRNDLTIGSDPNVTDKHQLEVFARERFLAPR